VVFPVYKVGRMIMLYLYRTVERTRVMSNVAQSNACHVVLLRGSFFCHNPKGYCCGLNCVP
jgi:hypothetical protein